MLEIRQYVLVSGCQWLIPPLIRRTGWQFRGEQISLPPPARPLSSARWTQCEHQASSCYFAASVISSRAPEDVKNVKCDAASPESVATAEQKPRSTRRGGHETERFLPLFPPLRYMGVVSAYRKRGRVPVRGICISWKLVVANCVLRTKLPPQRPPSSPIRHHDILGTWH